MGDESRMNRKRSISGVVTYISAALIALLTVAVPVGYFLNSYQYLVGGLEKEAEVSSEVVSRVISINPELWQLQALRLEEMLKRQQSSAEDPIRRQLFDLDGRLLVENQRPLGAPVLSRSVDIFDSGVRKGWTVASTSLMPLLKRTGLLAAAGLIVGLVVFTVVRTVPLRALYRSENALLETVSELESKTSELEDAYIRIENDRNSLRSALDFFASIISEIEKRRGFEGYEYRPPHNPDIPVCWEVMDCKYKGCPVYGKRNVRCWQIAGTHCQGRLQGHFARKFGDCNKCAVFQQAVRDPLREIGETFNNMIHVIEEKHKELIEACRAAEEANQIGRASCRERV